MFVFLITVRLIIFCIAWATTIGKIHFWLFPNLLADVGILESFQPVYTCDYTAYLNGSGTSLITNSVLLSDMSASARRYTTIFPSWQHI